MAQRTATVQPLVVAAIGLGLVVLIASSAKAKTAPAPTPALVPPPTPVPPPARAPTREELLAKREAERKAREERRERIIKERGGYDRYYLKLTPEAAASPTQTKQTLDARGLRTGVVSGDIVTARIPAALGLTEEKLVAMPEIVAVERSGRGGPRRRAGSGGSRAAVAKTVGEIVKATQDVMRQGHAASTSVGLMPVFEPEHNMREVCKQLCLLEDHLNQHGKRCDDCIRKHFLTIEALLEEGIGLDKTGEFKAALEKGLALVMESQRSWAAGEPEAQIAQRLRVLRKAWSERCFTASL